MAATGAIEPKVVDVPPGSELARLLDEADGAPLVLVKDGVRYRLEREDAKDDPWANDDPEQVEQVLAETAGAWKHIDAEALKADVRAQRGHGRDDDPS